MKQEGRVVCFVDDDPAEVEAFADVFSDDFTVIADSDPQAVLAELAARRLRANLFVLDLYFAKGRASSEEERNRMAGLKAEVDRAQKKLTDFLDPIGQSREGGLEIMRYLRENYPATPVVFYTRKGTLGDGVACLDAGADGICPKATPVNFDPSGDRLAQIVQATREEQDVLARRFRHTASTSSLMKKLIRIAKLIRNNWSKL